MRTFLKAILVGSAPAFAVTCIVGVAISSASSSPNADPGTAGIVPLAEAGIQPSTQPSTQPATQPTPPIRRGGGGGGGGAGRGARG
jgi:hypothetical protein